MPCDHSLRLGSLCAICGLEIVELESDMFCLLHNNDNLKTTKKEADEISKKRKKQLDMENKLILIFDLDQTILHASFNPLIEKLIASKQLKEKNISDKEDVHINKNFEEDQKCDTANINDVKNNKINNERDYNPKNIISHKNKNEKQSNTNQINDIDEVTKKIKIEENHTNKNIVHTFFLYNTKFYIKLRPFLHELLEYCIIHFEMHVYTMGNRDYAQKIVQIIDPKSKYFNNRIITRDENQLSLEKSLNRFTTEHKNVIVLDDRGDVWKFCKNLINVKPYFYFKEGDINNPDLLRKKQIVNLLIKPIDKDILDCNIMTGITYDNYIDFELNFVKNLLVNIHTQYFSKKKNVKGILKSLRKDIFCDLSFYIQKSNKSFINRKYIKKIIKYCGGTYNTKKNVDMVILIDESMCNDIGLQKHKCDLISYKWILECFYSFKRVEIKFYMLKSYVDDDFANELENEI
ncbi:CTD phosphatase Fcp1 [Binucleata daphniae]